LHALFVFTYFLCLPTVWLNYVFAGEAQIWNLGCVTQRFYLTNNKKLQLRGKHP